MVDLNRGEYFTGAWVISYLSCTVYEREMQPFPISRSSVYHLRYFIYLILLHAACKITFGFIQSLCCFFWYSLKYVQLLHLAMYQPDTLRCLWRKQGHKKNLFFLDTSSQKVDLFFHVRVIHVFHLHSPEDSFLPKGWPGPGAVVP